MIISYNCGQENNDIVTCYKITYSHTSGHLPKYSSLEFVKHVPISTLSI